MSLLDPAIEPPACSTKSVLGDAPPTSNSEAGRANSCQKSTALAAAGPEQRQLKYEVGTNDDGGLSLLPFAARIVPPVEKPELNAFKVAVVKQTHIHAHALALPFDPMLIGQYPVRRRPTFVTKVRIDHRVNHVATLVWPRFTLNTNIL